MNIIKETETFRISKEGGEVEVEIGGVKEVKTTPLTLELFKKETDKFNNTYYRSVFKFADMNPADELFIKLIEELLRG